LLLPEHPVQPHPLAGPSDPSDRSTTRRKHGRQIPAGKQLTPMQSKAKKRMVKYQKTTNDVSITPARSTSRH
jgi:hypothetical protein